MSDQAAASQSPAADYFALFGLERGFRVGADLAARYRDLQKSVHPDRYASGSDRERLLAVQRTALINEAYQTLKDPLRRARYLLEQAGLDAGLESNTAMDPAFLMEQMELREALDEARDAAEPASALARVSADVTDRVDALVAALEREFAAGDYQAACESVRRLQFMERLQQQAADLEEDFLAL